MKDHVIYIRTSTEEQNPENQIEKILTLLGRNVIDNNEYEVLEEKQSAFKDYHKREVFNNLLKEIKKRKITDLYVWDWDRIYRSRIRLKQFFEICKLYKVRVHSLRQSWYEELNNIPEPFNEIMIELMLNLLGYMAEDESKKKSERVKAAVRKRRGKTVSYKGKRWGRKPLPKQTKDRVFDLYKKGESIRNIAAQIKTTDKSKNMKSISKSAVHKIIQEYLGKNNNV